MKLTEAQIDHFWNVSADARYLGIVRITFSSLALFHLFAALPESMAFYLGKNGLLLDPFHLTEWGFSWEVFRTFTAAALILSLLGIASRLCLGFSLLWHFSLYQALRPIGWHVDALFFLFNLFLLFGNLDKRMSLRSWRQRNYPIRARAWRKSMPDPSNIAAPGLRLIQIQLTLVYLVAGISKLAEPQWLDGSAVQLFLTSWITWTAYDVPFWLSRVLTCWVLGLELFLPFALWFHRAQLAAFLGALSLHLAIAYTSEIGTFSFLMILGHSAYFYPRLVHACELFHQFVTAKTPPSWRDTWGRRKAYR